MQYSNVYILILLAIAHGVTTKIADLHNEHGLRWFPHAAIFFGLLWGITGSVLIVLDSDLANILLAMVVAFLARMRLDYRNHAIAATLMILTFLFLQDLDSFTFAPFFLLFLVVGSIKDHLDDNLHRDDWIKELFESLILYVLGVLLFSVLTQRWDVFFAFASYVLSYDMIKKKFQPDKIKAPAGQDTSSGPRT